jgi:RimJ/RimL family protein N-acetyltransferase
MASNGRANAVLRRLGATEEGHLRRSFLLGGEYHDDLLWALLADDWRRRDRGPQTCMSQSPCVAG